LRGETRWQSSEVVALGWRSTVAAVRAVAVVSVVATAILGRAVIAGGVVDALTV
jgi:hypothetical protein